MRYSRILVPTIKEVPADAEIISHQLLLRAGMMRKIASGTYTYLLLGWRSLLKIIAIVREEMNASGAQEIMMPSLQPMELWQRTGRDVDYGETMCRLVDRHGRENVLGPTAEEVVTFLAAGEINSYKQLPFNLYQISPKFRDEFRPRFGPIRSREFIMKDAYSFHGSPESLEETYRAMYDAYCRIFTRCGLEYVIVEAEVGEMGGSGSHQFTVPCESGEDTIVYTEDGSYAANLERANVDALPKQKFDGEIPALEEVHTPSIGSIEAVCDFLKTKPEQMIKTLIYSKDGKTIAALIRGDHDANEEKLCFAAGGGKIILADEVTIAKATNARVGFAGPVGLAAKVDKMIIDHAVAAMAVGVTGANKSDYHIKNVVPGRDFPLDGDNVILADIRNACQGDTHNGKKILFKKGIEVGQVFKLGTKYSEKLGAKYLDENNNEKACLMGCYGIGINRILASAIELGNDKDGIIWPVNIAPFEVIVTCVNQDDEEVAKAAEDIYQKLLDNGVDILLDDRLLRAGAKFKDADLIGIPIRITVGKKSLAEGNVEIKLRRETESEKIKIEEALVRVRELIERLRT
jgi:prolyl-tRNA synthetase